MQIDLGYRPRPWQHECHLAMARYSVFALHRRAGKTELGLAELTDAALKAPAGQLALFGYVAPYLNQATRIVWRRLKQKLKPLIDIGRATVFEQDKAVEFRHNGARITLFGGDNLDALRGVALNGVVIDEVAQMPPEIWEDVIYPALQDRHGWAIFIGTPKGVDLFHELFVAGSSRPGWISRVYTVYDTGVFSPAEIEDFKANMSEAAFRREFLCDFSASSVDQLLSLMDVEDAAQRKLKAEDVSFAPRVIGVDPARYGDDRSAIIQRQGLHAFGLRVFPDIDNMTLAATVAELATRWQADAVFVDAGAGAGVIDRLRQLQFRNVHEVNFGGRPADAAYTNKRAEIWHLMAEWVRSGGVIPNDVNLKRALASVRYRINPRTNKREIETKDEIKERGLPSPDEGDALAVTFALPIAPRTEVDPVFEAIAGLRSRRRDFNPFEHGVGSVHIPGRNRYKNRAFDPYQGL